MRNIISFFLFGHFLISCGYTNPETRYNETAVFHELIFTGIIDTNATLCVSKGEFHIYAEFPNFLSSSDGLSIGRYDHFFRLSEDDSIIVEPVGDSLSVNEFRALIQDNASNCYDSLGNFDFQYYSTSGKELTLEAGETIEHAIITNDRSIYSIFNSKTWQTDLVVILMGDTIRTAIGNAHEKIDFFLHDFAGDSMPEIFVTAHFRMPSTVTGEVPMIRLEIYQLRFK